MEITQLSLYQKNRGIVQCVRHDQIHYVRKLVEMGVSNSALWSAYAASCVHGAIRCENYLKNLIIKQGERNVA